MDKKRLESICSRGEEAETLLNQGKHREALAVLTKLEKELEKSGDFDSYLAAKITLEQLRCHVKLGDFKSAYDVWNSHLEESLHGIGIYALESAQTTLKDMIAYDMICAFLHTLGDSDRKTAAAAVNQYLSRVCEQAYDDGDRVAMKAALSNWKQHLRAIFGGSIPHRIAEPLIHQERRFGDSVKPEALAFPAGSSWQRPSDFLEISRFGEIRESKPATPDAVKRPGKRKAAG